MSRNVDHMSDPTTSFATPTTAPEARAHAQAQARGPRSLPPNADDVGHRTLALSASSSQPPSPPPPVSNSRKRNRTAAAAAQQRHANALANSSATTTTTTNSSSNSNDSAVATDDDDMSESNDYYGSMQLRELLPQAQRSTTAADDLEAAKLRARRGSPKRVPMLRTLVLCGAALSLLLLTTYVYISSDARASASASTSALAGPLSADADVHVNADAATAAAAPSRDELLQQLLSELETFSEPEQRVSANGALHTTLHVRPVRFTNGPIAFWTRAYESSVPGPTLRVKPGDTLEIELVNELGPDVPGAWTLNTLHNPNTTNLHVHGMHVDPTGIADNVSRVVAPGERALTRIHVPKDHPRGLFHYHPHYHGSVFAQMGGGMAGALIVDDDPETDELPPAYHAMAQHVLVFQEFRFSGGLGSSAVAVAKASRSRLALQLAYTRKCELDERVKDLYPRVHQSQVALDIPMDPALEATYPRDESSGPPITDYFTVNGQYLPKLTVRAGENRLLRLVNAGGVCTLELSLPGCSMTLTASDGIYLRAPRAIETLILSNGARADVVINCAANSHELEPLRPLQSVQHDALEPFLGVSTDVFAGVVAFVEVTNEPSLQQPVIAAIPAPSALYDEHASLLTLNAADRAKMDPTPFTFAFSMGGTTHKDGFEYKNYFINGKEFDGVSMRSMPLGVVQEWVIVNTHLVGGAAARANHPFHMHTNAFQVVAMSHGEGAEYEVGDWRDVISVPTPGNVTIRFRPVDFTGVVVAHCHVLGHSDGGMVAAVTITP